MSEWSNLGERVAGKWQMPLLVVSVGMLGLGLLRLNPKPAQLSPVEAVRYLEKMVSDGLFDDAVKLGRSILRQEGQSDAELAPVHLQLARATYGRARKHRVTTPAMGTRIVEHYDTALCNGEPLLATDFERMGRALEWKNEPRLAIEQYEKAIAAGIAHSSDLRRRTVAMWQALPDTPPERLREMFDGLLEEVEAHRLDIRLWAIEQELYVLEDLGRLGDASTLLVQNRGAFEASDLRDHFGFLEALLLYKEGNNEEVEAYLRTVRNRLDEKDEVHAMTGWLLGRVVLSDGGPQRPLEALSFFRDVVASHGGSPYGVASRIGMGEALGFLERHEEAIDEYRVAVEELGQIQDHRVVSRDSLRTSLMVTAELQRQADQLPAALEYAQLAYSLVDRRNTEQTTLVLQQLARIQSLRAEEALNSTEDDSSDSRSDVEEAPAETRELFSQAAATFVELLRINTPNERRSVESLWQAAELYTQAGELARAAQLYRTFAMERPFHTLVPRALLRIGNLKKRMGSLEGAIRAFQECYQRFPKSYDGSRALIPLAQCYLASGPDNEELAERTLRIVLEESEVMTPRAPEFADAMFMLGSVLGRRGLFEQAIATLEESIDRYPSDPRVSRALFVLADSYLHSGLALVEEMADAKFGGELREMRLESVRRFAHARELYREVIDEYEGRGPRELDPLERLYLRYAHLYEADCYFETKEFREALRRYEEAAGLFRDSTSGLAAYVQIINCHVFTGKPREARAALARALILVDSIPSEAYTQSLLRESRSDWKRYFEWLGQSELF